MPASPTYQLSILVPVYNSGELLEPCLRSLAAQSVAGMEVICLDDGSTDGSGAVLDAWAARDARFKVIHCPNGGYGKAMNTALQAAQGTWVGIVEPDDEVEPTMYSHLLELAAGTRAPVVKGSYTIVRGGSSHPAGKFATLPPGTELAPEHAADYILGAPAIWSAIYRRDWLLEHGIRFQETPGASFQDLGFSIRTWAAAPRICCTPAGAYHYREDNPNSSTRKLDSGAWAALRELQALEDVYAGISSAPMRHLLVRRIFHTMQADYRLRISCRVKEFLLGYSGLLRRHFPLHTLDASAFRKREWHDIRLLYKAPRYFPRLCKGNLSVLQRIYSCRREGGRRMLRLCGFSFMLSR